MLKKIVSNLRECLQKKADLLGLLAFSITVLFITFPNLLLSANIEEIPEASTFYKYFFVGAFFVYFVFAIAILLIPSRIGLYFASLLSAYAIIVIVFDFIMPLNIGPIEEGTESVQAAPTIIGAVQIILILTVCFVLLYVPKKLCNIFAWSLTAVLLFSGLHLLFISPNMGYGSYAKSCVKKEAQHDLNIYHIVFDAYYGPWLQWSLSELSKDNSELAGFNHYRRNVSNYYATRSSYASFMTGTMYSPEKTMVEWYRNANENSIIDDLHEQGFITTFYGLGLRHGVRQVQFSYTDDPGETGIVDIKLAADYCILRVAPIIFRHKVLDDRGAGPITRHFKSDEEIPSGDIRNVVSYRQFKKFLNDEKMRSSTGHYVHVYLYPPHGPYQLNRHGEYIGESSYDEQLHLATNMLLEIVENLNDLDRFDNSFIIVHADHGSGRAGSNRYVGDPMRGFIRIDKETSELISNIDVRFQEGRLLEGRYQALLLIKPPGVGGNTDDLIINDNLTQLLDLREYIRKVIIEGNYSYKYPQKEKVIVHHGTITQQKRDGTRLSVGRDITSGRINKYIINSDGSWGIGSDIPFVYD